eukprot:scaffold253260_cov17-Tisochrysis_lutea.AAC.1
MCVSCACLCAACLCAFVQAALRLMHFWQDGMESCCLCFDVLSDCRGSGACRSGVVGAQEVCDQDCGRAQDCATTMASCVCHQGIVGDDAKARQVALGTIESLVRLVLLPDMRIINYPATDP